MAGVTATGGVYGGDLGERLQQLIAGWHGAERNQPLTDLHVECKAAAGAAGRDLLPAQVLLVRDLAATALSSALRRLAGVGRGAAVQFRVPPAGRFDAALVPVGQAGQPPDSWALAIAEGLSPADQVALYAHALGHALLNRDAVRLGQMPPLDPRDGYTHVDTLGELRLLESTRQPINRRVLTAYPRLTALLHAREEPPGVLALIAPDFRDRLAASGWRGQFVESPYIFTAGRILTGGAVVRRGPRLRADALLRAEAGLPIALVQTLRPNEERTEVERRVAEYARERMGLPFAYILEGPDTVHELDWTAGRPAPDRAVLAAVPRRDELLARWTAALGLTDERDRETLTFPYELGGGWRPRYYQEAAINRAVMAVLQARRRLRRPRILLTLATGTGKTPIAFQLVWKLKRSRAIKRVLYLTDRDYLLGQAMDTHFAPFGDARARVQGEIDTVHEILFATYQAIADDETRPGLYREYPWNFFDLVIVDECHRGSAQDDSKWRAILEHFEAAVQIGMTATPLHTALVQTDAYFGLSLYTYPLWRGVTDGFLAPYRVRRILMGTAAERSAARSDRADDAAMDADLLGGEAQEAADVLSAAELKETGATLVERTETIAEHLAGYLQRTEPMDKTIVFCADQDHAERMRLALERRCPELVGRYPDYVERIVADEGAEGKRALGRFTTPDERTPAVVTTSKLLSTGVDVPTCQNIVLARPVGSVVEFKQINGRGTRLHEPEKTWFTILDYAGATHHFFDPDFDGDPEQVEIESLVPQPATEAGGLSSVPEVVPAVPGAPGVPGAPPPDAETPPPGADVEQTVHVAYGHAVPRRVPEQLVPEPYARAGAPGLRMAEQSAGSTAAQGTAQVGHAPPWLPDEHPTARTASRGRPDYQGGGPPESETAPPPPPSTEELERHARTRADDGTRIAVIGEIVYELGPDGRTLRTRSYQDYTREALQGLCRSPAELREQWLRPELRQEIRTRLEDEGVKLGELAAALKLPDADPLDLLLYVAFGQHALTRADRANHVRRTRASFFDRFRPAAREILDMVLEKYIRGEAPDVSDPDLLRFPPISERGTFMEVVRPFGGGEPARQALRELETLLYTSA